MREEKRITADRKLLRILLPGLCMLVWGLPARAYMPESVSLEGRDDEARVTVSVSDSDVASLQLGLEVKITEGTGADVSFAFDPGLSGSVQQYRYQKETGVLTVYVSGDGRTSLADAATGEISLGKVILSSGTGTGASATVRVKKDSLKLVNSVYDMQQRAEVHAPGEARLTAGDGGAGGPGQEQPGGTPLPPGPDGNLSGNPVGDGSFGGSDGSGNPAGSASVPVRTETPASKVSFKSGSRRDIGIRQGNDRTVSVTEPAVSEPEGTDTGSVREPELSAPGSEKEDGGVGFLPEKGRLLSSVRLTDALVAVGAAASAVLLLLMGTEYRRMKKRARRRAAGRKKRPAGRKKKPIGRKKRKSAESMKKY